MSIKVENLTKYYGEQAAVNNISFEIKTGEIVGFLGPNGAGKSTTMKMITTYLTPNSGKISVEDLDTAENSLEVRKRIGYLPEQNPLYQDMNVIEYLEYAAELESVPKANIKAAVKNVVDKCGLEEVRYKDIGELSKGYKQRVGLAQAMIHDPQVLILDEPTSGLDPNQIVEIRKLIKELGKEKTLILSTHIMQEVQALCDRVLIINRGEIVADGTPDELQKSFKGENIINVDVRKDANTKKEDLVKAFKEIPKVKRVEVVKENEESITFNIHSDSDADIKESLFKKAVSMNLNLLSFKQESGSLEDVFRKLTT